MAKIICLFCFSFICASGVFAQDPNFLRARTVSEAYLHNRESFSSFKCKFKYSTGWASTYDKAINEEFNANTSRSSASTWLMKDNFEKYEVIQNLEKNQVKGNETVDGSTFALRNGAVSLVYASSIKGANIRPPDYDGRWIEVTPFNMVIMGNKEFRSPHACVKKAIAGEFELKEITEKQIDGKKYYTLSVFDSNTKDSNVLSMLIDPMSGYLPVEYKVHNSKNQLKSECKLLESRKMANGSWFPISSRTLVYFNPGDPSSKIFVYNVRVLEIEVPGNPKPEDFYIDLPKGTEIANPSNLVGSFRLKENRRMLATELDDVLNDTVKIIRAEKRLR